MANKSNYFPRRRSHFKNYKVILSGRGSREYVVDGDYNYTKTLVEDNYRPYKEENNRYDQKYYRDYLYEKKRGYDSHGVGIFGKVLNDRESVEQYREYTDTLERDLREISNIGIDGRKESSRRSQTF